MGRTNKRSRLCDEDGEMVWRRQRSDRHRLEASPHIGPVLKRLLVNLHEMKRKTQGIFLNELFSLGYRVMQNN
jgi:hypothetical protein